MEARDVAYLVDLAETRLGSARRAHSWPWLRDDDGGFLTVDAFWPDAAVSLVVVAGSLEAWRHAPAEAALRGIRLVVLGDADLPTAESVGRARQLDSGPGDREPHGPSGGSTDHDGDDASGLDDDGSRWGVDEGLDGDEDEGPWDDERYHAPGDCLARDDRVLLERLADRGLYSPAPAGPPADERAPAGTDAAPTIAPRGADEDEDEEAGHDAYDADPSSDSDTTHAGRTHEARTLARDGRPSGGDIWEDSPSGPPGEAADWSDAAAGIPAGWRTGPRLLAALGAAALTRRCFDPRVLGGLEPVQVQVLAALRLSPDLDPEARSDTPAGLARRLGLREGEVREAVARLAALGLLWEVRWMDDRLLVTRAGRDALDAWLDRLGGTFGRWPAGGTEADDAG
jgi:DNA-binding MarR family transcriptional regulator